MQFYVDKACQIIVTYILDPPVISLATLSVSFVLKTSKLVYKFRKVYNNEKGKTAINLLCLRRNPKKAPDEHNMKTKF